MNFWWVNANQTYEYTLAGGFLWSPKLKKNRGRNEFYDTMPRVRPGDVIFVFRQMYVTALGVATSVGYSAERPEHGFEFNDWNRDGWRVDVDLHVLKRQIRPRDHMDLLAPLLPLKYSPIRPNGDGLQGVYLASVPSPMASALGGLIGSEFQVITGTSVPAVSSEVQAETTIHATPQQVSPLSPPSRLPIEAPIRNDPPPDTFELFGDLDVARIAVGRAEQGVLRNLLIQGTRSTDCSLCGMHYPVEFLVAAHIKRRADCSDDEKRDIPAVAMLACRFGCDELYERGFISVASNGDILVTTTSKMTDDLKIRLDEFVGLQCTVLNSTNEPYFKWHRENVFLSDTGI